jgi:uncharacterized protein (DUF1330 family)
MSAYWIGRAQMRDLEGYKRYGSLVAAAAKIYPNQVLARAGKYQVVEGPDDFDRYVLLKFPSMEAALAYYNSPEYQEAAAIRRAASGRCEIAITEGID